MGCAKSSAVVREIDDYYITDPPLPNKYLPEQERYKKASDLSPVHERPFIYEGVKWPTLIHCIYGQRYLNDKKVSEIFSEMRDINYVIHLAHESEDFRRVYQPLERTDWETYKVTAMLNALRAKFGQHRDLAQLLLETEGNLVYLSPDKFWGADMVPHYAKAEGERGLMHRGSLKIVGEHGTKIINAPNRTDGNGRPFRTPTTTHIKPPTAKTKRLERQFKEMAGANVLGVLLTHLRNELRQGRSFNIRLPTTIYKFDSKLFTPSQGHPDNDVTYNSGYMPERDEQFLNYDDEFVGRAGHRQYKTVFGQAMKVADQLEYNVHRCDHCDNPLTPLEVEQGYHTCRPCRRQQLMEFAKSNKRFSKFPCCGGGDDIDARRYSTGTLSANHKYSAGTSRYAGATATRLDFDGYGAGGAPAHHHHHYPDHEDDYDQGRWSAGQGQGQGRGQGRLETSFL